MMVGNDAMADSSLLKKKWHGAHMPPDHMRGEEAWLHMLFDSIFRFCSCMQWDARCVLGWQQ